MRSCIILYWVRKIYAYNKKCTFHVLQIAFNINGWGYRTRAGRDILINNSSVYKTHYACIELRVHYEPFMNHTFYDIIITLNAFTRLIISSVEMQSVDK